MRSIPIQQFKKGYKMHAAALGYKQVSARPWQINDVQTVLQHILQKLKRARGLPASSWLFCGRLPAEDVTLGPGAWRTSSSPQVKLAVPNSYTDTLCRAQLLVFYDWHSIEMLICAGHTALPFLQPKLTLPIGAKVYLQPDRTYTGARDGPMAVEIRGDELCSMTWLQRSVALSLELGQPISGRLARTRSPSWRGG